MNAAIRRELDRLNLAPDGLRREPPRHLVEANERAFLQPLPREPLGVGRVGRPQGRAERPCACRAQLLLGTRRLHVGRSVVAARIGERMVEVFLEEGGERIAVHPRKNGRNQYATLSPSTCPTA